MDLTRLTVKRLKNLLSYMSVEVKNDRKIVIGIVQKELTVLRCKRKEGNINEVEHSKRNKIAI